jgi:hypothetical protein
VRWPEDRPSSFPPISDGMAREEAEQFAASYQGVKGEVVHRWRASGPWILAPIFFPVAPTSGSNDPTASG